MKTNLSLEELYIIMNGNLFPTIADYTYPEWADDLQNIVSDYCAAQLGSRVVLKKYDPDEAAPFWVWWTLQVKTFVESNNWEFTKKYALLGLEYDAGVGKGYHKKIDDDFTHGHKIKFTPGVTETFTPGVTETFTPGSTYTTTHTNDKTTHSERTFDSDTITPISSDEATGSSQVAGSGYDQTSRTGYDQTSRTGNDNTENSGKDQRDLEEDYNEILSPFEWLEGERRVAAWNFVAEVANRLSSCVTYALWKEEDF